MTANENMQVPELAGPSVKACIAQLCACVLAGVLTFLAFPFGNSSDVSFWPLAWVSLVPLLWAMSVATPKRAFVYGLVSGTVTNFGGFWWIGGMLEEFGHLSGWLAWPLSFLNGVYQGLHFALFAMIVALVRTSERRLPSPWILAIIFTAVEFVFPLIFPWYLGNSQHPFRTFVQSADVLGVSGVTFLLVLANGLIAEVLTHVCGIHTFRVRHGLSVAVTLLASFIYGALRLAAVDEAIQDAPTLKIGMVEANIGIWEKEAKGLAGRERALMLHGNLLTHHHMSRRLSDDGAELIVWPESSYYALGKVYGKRSRDFVVGAGQSGRLSLWQHGADGGFVMRDGPRPTSRLWPLKDVATLGEETVVSVGLQGSVLFYDGEYVHTVPVETLDGKQARTLNGVAIRRVRSIADGTSDKGLEEVGIWAVGDGGVVFTGNTDGIKQVPSGTNADLHAVALVSGQQGLIVGDSGTMLAFDGERIGSITGVTQAKLATVWVAPDTKEVWVAGDEGVILHGGQTGWIHETPASRTDFRALAGHSSKEVWAIGHHGIVVKRGEDSRWRRESFPKMVNLIAMTVEPRGTLFAADATGGLWRRHGDPEPQWVEVPRETTTTINALAPLDYVPLEPIPRDVQYLYQSTEPPTKTSSFLADPDLEFRFHQKDRNALQRGFKTPLLFGAITRTSGSSSKDDGEEPGVYNSAILLDEMGQVVDVYDKNRLLLFGETIPFGDVFPAFYDWIPEAGNFERGRELKVFEWKGHRIGIMVCYEDILPRFAALLAEGEPEVFINMTNDAWFGRTSEPYLHLNLAVMRSIESHRSLLRSTNTGVSAVIDPVGRIEHQTLLDDPEVVLTRVPMMKGSSLAKHLGQPFGILLCVLTLILLGWRRSRNSDTIAG